MIEINFNNVTKSYGFDIVLNNINIDIKTGEKIALVGENGSGKSTFLKLITKEENVTNGSLSTRNKSKIGYLKQDFDQSNELVIDILFNSYKEIKEIEKELKKIEKKMDEGINEKIINRYCELQEKYQDKGGYLIEEEIDKLTSYFDIDVLKDKNYNSLSGGEKRIVMFISLILSKPNIILLDEPTNHLDIDMLEKLENYIINSNKTFIIVSHDRFFLDKTVNKVLLIENGNLEIFHGNYTNYIDENKKRIEIFKQDYKEQQRQINNMKRQIKQLKEWGNVGAGNEIFSKRALSIEKRLEKM
ncbi:MAG: ABC-F family ATP-binding cassette domain-containing protein, partial [Bacilli bacterium]|nr:ABC-F family ATP-binding cassette domain-containing protein [Bacilli bacterium]